MDILVRGWYPRPQSSLDNKLSGAGLECGSAPSLPMKDGLYARHCHLKGIERARGGHEA